MKKKTPIRCLAVDDEPLALTKLSEYIRKVPWLELVGSCENTLEAGEKLNEDTVDAMFLDINMPGLNGLEFAASLDRPPLVVFTTAYAEYAIDSFKVQPVDYLLKPFDFADFQRAAFRLQRRFNGEAALNDIEENSDAIAAVSSPRHDATLFVKVDYRYVGVNPAEILYIKGMSEYVRIIMDGKAPLTTLLSMREALSRLPQDFMQVHRSYIVNMNRVCEISRQQLIMPDGMKITVSDNFRAAFAAWLRAHSLERDKKGQP